MGFYSFGNLPFSSIGGSFAVFKPNLDSNFQIHQVLLLLSRLTCACCICSGLAVDSVEPVLPIHVLSFCSWFSIRVSTTCHGEFGWFNFGIAWTTLLWGSSKFCWACWGWIARHHSDGLAATSLRGRSSRLRPLWKEGAFEQVQLTDEFLGLSPLLK